MFGISEQIACFMRNLSNVNSGKFIESLITFGIRERSPFFGLNGKCRCVVCCRYLQFLGSWERMNQF